MFAQELALYQGVTRNNLRLCQSPNCCVFMRSVKLEPCTELGRAHSIRPTIDQLLSAVGSAQSCDDVEQLSSVLSWVWKRLGTCARSTF
jgi:hypothetical protein